MYDGNLLGFGRPAARPDSDGPATEYVVVQRPLDRVLAFIGRSIDDVVNDRLVKNQVVIYYKLDRWVKRESEISEMERAWNPLGMRT
jgi:hypothetical protein